jgi:hypothetical protein
MASETSIKAAIERVLGVNYTIWTIGVTDDTVRRRREHSNPSTWLDWNADTETAARNVEAYFIAKRMKGGPGGGGRANYVYIF